MTTISLRPQPLLLGSVSSSTRSPARLNTGRATGIAAVAAVGSVPPITALHLAATAPMDPAGWTISDYVVGVPEGIALYGMTAGLLAIGGMALASALRTRPGTAAVRVLLRIWAVAAVLTAAFPTNLRGTPETVSSTIHLTAGAVVFAVLPAVGWALTRSRHGLARSGWLRWTSMLAGALSAALILNRLPGVLGMPATLLAPGILQRAAGALLILLLAVMALALRRSPAGGPASAESPHLAAGSSIAPARTVGTT